MIADTFDALMTREEMLDTAGQNRETQYTTEEMWESGDYVVVDASGYLVYSNGEEVLDETDLAEDGWFDCTDMEDPFDNDYNRDGYYNDPLYDEYDD